MNEQKFRQRTAKEARDRMDARREAKQEQRRREAGRMFWPADRGTLNEGRNVAKRERRAQARQFAGIAPARITEPKPVRPAYRVRLPIVRKLKVLTHAPRSRKGSTSPAWKRRAANRRRDKMARGARRA